MSTYVNRSAYDAMREQIVSGALKPGERLSEYAQAKRMGVSRGPIREAVSQLVSEGLVEKFPGIGAFVRAADPDEVAAIFGFREALESFAAAAACERITTEQLAAIDEQNRVQGRLVDALKKSGRSDFTSPAAAAWIAADVAFHETIVAAAGNVWIERHVKDARFLGGVFGQRPDPAVHDLPALFAESNRQHRRIATALRRRDASEAREAMSVHIRVTRDLFVKQAERAASRAWPVQALRRGRSAVEFRESGRRDATRAK